MQAGSWDGREFRRSAGMGVAGPLFVLGLIFVLSATRRVVAQNETVPESAHAELDAPDEEEP
jgi:hypothetical protein